MVKENPEPEKWMQRKQPVLFTHHQHNDLIDLNEVLQKALLLFPNSMQNGNIVVRWDSLPSVAGDQPQLLEAFQLIISGILNVEDTSTKQFLHIGCSVENPEIMDLSLPAGHKNFQIEFRSNLKCRSAGIGNDSAVREIRQLLHQNKAEVKVQISEDDYCFVTVSISGKI